LVLQGPHFHVANPRYQTPKEICNTNRAYDDIDLTTMPVDYLPRSNYAPACSPEEYQRRIPTWQCPQTTSTTKQAENPTFKTERFNERYRLVWRKMLAITGERTLIGAIVPPGCCNIDGCFSIVFANNYLTSLFAGITSSLLADFYVRVSGKANLRGDTIGGLPCPTTTPYAPAIIARTLRLNCLTNHYAALWDEQWPLVSAAYQAEMQQKTTQTGKDSDQHKALDHRRTHANEVAARQGREPLTYQSGRYVGNIHLANAATQSADAQTSNATSTPQTQQNPSSLSEHPGKTWTEYSPLRTDFARRQTLVELDALAALALGLTLEELLTIYRVQFPVLQEYEHDDRYDQLGKKLPTRALRTWETLKENDSKNTTPFAFEGQIYYPPFTACRREDDLAQAYHAFNLVAAITGVHP
jgi:hypothetical protein